MFDIDGTLLESYALDSKCYIQAIKRVIGLDIDSNWQKYQHVTDSGILDEIIRLNGMADEQDVRDSVKNTFVAILTQKIKQKPVREIPGAAIFVSQLHTMNNVTVSFATGGWYESAALKLESAGIAFSEIPFASSNDHISRIEIMKTAADREACFQLGFNFVLIGNKIKHKPSFNDFKSVDRLMSCIGM